MMKNDCEDETGYVISTEEIESLVLDYGSSCCLLGAYEIIGINDERIENRKNKTEAYQKKLLKIIRNLKSSQSSLLKNESILYSGRGGEFDRK